MVLPAWFEHATSPLPRVRSTAGAMAALAFRRAEKTELQFSDKRDLLFQRVFWGVITLKTRLSYHKLILISNSNHSAMADFARSSCFVYASINLSGLPILTCSTQSGCINSKINSRLPLHRISITNEPFLSNWIFCNGWNWIFSVLLAMSLENWFWFSTVRDLEIRQNSHWPILWNFNPASVQTTHQPIPDFPTSLHDRKLTHNCL